MIFVAAKLLQRVCMLSSQNLFVFCDSTFWHVGVIMATYQICIALSFRNILFVANNLSAVSKIILACLTVLRLCRLTNFGYINLMDK